MPDSAAGTLLLTRSDVERLLDARSCIDAGVMTRTRVRASLGDVVVDPTRGRRNADEVIIFDSTGVAIEDVAAAAVVWQRAVKAGAGSRVRLSD